MVGKPDVRENVPLGPLTTLRVGGPARYYAEAADVSSLRVLTAFASERRCPLWVLGGGSNVLVGDEGFDGLVVRYVDASLGATADGGGTIVHAGAGLRWDDLVSFAVGEGLAGVECLSGIPGLVGAGPIQNIGAYGQEIGEVVVGVRYLVLASGAVRTLSRADCGFAYRRSWFKQPSAPPGVVLRVDLGLRRGGPPTLRYPELRRRIAEAGGGAGPSLADVRRTVLDIRRAKAMLDDDPDDPDDPDDADQRSAGSFFVNPVVSGERADAVARAARAGTPPPRYPAGAGQVKLSAAWLIEHAGFHRGYTKDGRAALSSRHTLALVNRAGASARDILGLARTIRDAVLARFGVRLLPEPVLVGFPPAEIEDLRLPR